MTTTTHQQVQDYYGRILQGSKDLKTNACCAGSAVAGPIRAILGDLDSEIIERFYGCGSPIPPALQGCTVVDLGCGTGRDAYVCSKLAGPSGRVIGVDMTPEQLDVAQRHVDSQAARFGFERSNTRFAQGYMEDLSAVGIEDASVDVVISNCVINLAPDKRRVFEEIFRVLKPGGEVYFSDVFADRRLPDAWREDPVLVGECLGGAMYVEDFRRLLQGICVRDYRVVESSRITINNREIEEKVGLVRFDSKTVRGFKLASLEDRCEDYGQVAWYQGTIENAPHAFVLDADHTFETGKPVPVCGNTAAMLTETRLARHFVVAGDRSRHLGLFRRGGGASVRLPTVGSGSGVRCC